MDTDRPLALLGGLSPAAFMRRHWQRRPLLVRGALPGLAPPLGRAALFALAARDDVESRLVVRDGARWTVRHGPLPRRALPPLARGGWTLLVQGLDLHVPAARSLLERFRFVPDARLDDLMVSWASDGGGVGPHVDSYDVFLVQASGRRRWRIARPADEDFVPGLPLRILQRFEPEQEWLLEPGDLLYLPPRWGHDGVAEGECTTCSIGFRAAERHDLARELLPRLADAAEGAGALYRDPRQPATAHPAAIPPALQAFARDAIARVLAAPDALERALGEVLSEPKPQVWFDAGTPRAATRGVVLDARSRMLYDARHVYLNGEAFVAGGRDRTLMRRLADERRLDAAQVARLSAQAAALLDEWIGQGWLHGSDA
ncbi:MAG: cupin domain-containing protein [Rubrivivax sp.]|nr:cupin domain-containing protein [Rubrivivax sp.]